jgi:hypothetical protein
MQIMQPLLAGKAQGTVHVLLDACALVGLGTLRLLHENMYDAELFRDATLLDYKTRDILQVSEMNE